VLSANFKPTKQPEPVKTALIISGTEIKIRSIKKTYQISILVTETIKKLIIHHPISHFKNF